METRVGPKILFLVGPTGSGKSALALQLAKSLGGEIISADSMQVYKGMDIGTDKPSRAVRRKIPHHLLDAVSVSREFSVYEYRRLALDAAAAVLKKGKTPIVAGGTGLYVKALVDGISPQPGKNEVLRAGLAAEAKDKGLAFLYERLKSTDPAVAARVHPNDEKRIVRALEVFELSGRRLSDWERETVTLEQSGYRFVMAGLMLDRDELYRKIDSRVDCMFRKGLVREARGLFRKKLSLTARQAIGYRELFEHFAGVITLAEAREQIKQNTRHFAKRQLTWFRREARIRWFDPRDPECAEKIVKLVSAA